MIIDLPEFVSLNRLTDVPAGRFLVVESIYRRAGNAPCAAILSELIPEGSNASLGADLQVVLADGSILFRDFAIDHDGSWRDSYGAKANTLADLLPLELARLKLEQQRGALVEHDGSGQLTLIHSEEPKHGT
jgi:hypothetical protein